MDDFIKDTYIYTSYDVAMYFAQIFRKQGIPLNRISIQKYMYIVYGVYLAVYGSRLVNEHPIVAFDMPFFPELDEDLMNQAIGDKSIHVSDESMAEMTQDAKLNGIISFVICKFGDSSSSHLDFVICRSAIKHAKTRENLAFGGYLSDEDIREDFEYYKTEYMKGF